MALSVAWIVTPIFTDPPEQWLSLRCAGDRDGAEETLP
jgi:hypothetical protein